MSEEQTDIERIHTVTWEDPKSLLKAAQTMSGLEILRAVQAGELPTPPTASLIGLEFAEIEEGRVVFSMRPAEYHYNPAATVHGGITTTILDSAMTCAVQTMLPAGMWATTLDITTHFLRPVTIETGVVYGEAKVVHLGGRIATAESRLTDAQGKLYAHGSTTCMVFRLQERS